MQITITTIIEISEENIPLIPVVIDDNGGKTEAETQDEAVKRILEDYFQRSTFSLISPSIPSYFGRAMAEVAEYKLGQLREAITVNVSTHEN